MSVFVFLMLRIAISLHCHYSELSKQTLNPLENWESTLSKETAVCRQSELAWQLARRKLKYKALPSLWAKSFYKCPSKMIRIALKEAAGACVQQSVWWRRGKRAFPWNRAEATSSGGTIAMNVSSAQHSGYLHIWPCVAPDAASESESKSPALVATGKVQIWERLRYSCFW